MWFSLVVGRGGSSLAVVHALFIAMASPRAAQTPAHAGFSGCSRWAQQLWFLGSRAQTHSCGARA